MLWSAYFMMQFNILSLRFACAKLAELEIHLENERPFKVPYRRLPPALIPEVREHLSELLEVGTIRHSN